MIDRPTATERGATPKFLLEYHADRDVMLYASAAKGYRVGGFNGDLSPTCDADLAAVGMTRAQTLKYNSDTLWNYELGAKTSFADRKVTANVAAFRIDWSDIQQNVLLSCGFPFIGNSGKARSTGFEIEINARPVRALELGLALGYTDAKITKAGNGTPQLKGSPVYQVPKWTAAVKAEYSAPLSSRFEGFVRGDYSFTDSSSSANNKLVADGSTVEVFYDEDNNDVTICIIDTYVGTISSKEEKVSDPYVVVNSESLVTEKDAENGYILFEYTSPESGNRVCAGAIELVKNKQTVQVTVQIPAMPQYHEQMIADALSRKLTADYGEPTKKTATPDPDAGTPDAG